MDKQWDIDKIPKREIIAEIIASNLQIDLEVIRDEFMAGAH